MAMVSLLRAGLSALSPFCLRLLDPSVQMVLMQAMVMVTLSTLLIWILWCRRYCYRQLFALDPLVLKVLWMPASFGSFGAEGTDADSSSRCSGSFGLVGTVAEFAGVGSSGVEGTVTVISLFALGPFVLKVL